MHHKNLEYNNTQKMFHTVSPHLDEKRAAQNLDSVSKFLPMVFDTLTRQRSNYLPSVQHMALDVLDNSGSPEALSHPTENTRANNIM